jgi:hypothetical protein
MRNILIAVAMWVGFNSAGQYLGKFTSYEICKEYVRSFNGTCQYYRGY